jgi:large conductance mechanosensitive channel
MENIVEKTKDIVDSTQEKVNKGIMFVIDFLKNNLVGFLKFLFDRNIIQTGIGIIIASQISKIANVIVESFINPIVRRVSVGTIDDITNWELTFFDIKIKIGLILSTIINFLLIAVVVYYIWKLSQNTNFDFIKEFLEDSKENINKTKTKVVINVGSPVVY